MDSFIKSTQLGALFLALGLAGCQTSNSELFDEMVEQNVSLEEYLEQQDGSLESWEEKEKKVTENWDEDAIAEEIAMANEIEFNDPMAGALDEWGDAPVEAVVYDENGDTTDEADVALVGKLEADKSLESTDQSALIGVPAVETDLESVQEPDPESEPATTDSDRLDSEPAELDARIDLEEEKPSMNPEVAAVMATGDVDEEDAVNFLLADDEGSTTTSAADTLLEESEEVVDLELANDDSADRLFEPMAFKIEEPVALANADPEYQGAWIEIEEDQDNFLAGLLSGSDEGMIWDDVDPEANDTRYLAELEIKGFDLPEINAFDHGQVIDDIRGTSAKELVASLNHSESKLKETMVASIDSPTSRSDRQPIQSAGKFVGYNSMTAQSSDDFLEQELASAPSDQQLLRMEEIADRTMVASATQIPEAQEMAKVERPTPVQEKPSVLPEDQSVATTVLAATRPEPEQRKVLQKKTRKKPSLYLAALVAKQKVIEVDTMVASLEPESPRKFASAGTIPSVKPVEVQKVKAPVIQVAANKVKVPDLKVSPAPAKKSRNDRMHAPAKKSGKDSPVAVAALQKEQPQTNPEVRSAPRSRIEVPATATLGYLVSVTQDPPSRATNPRQVPNVPFREEEDEVIFKRRADPYLIRESSFTV